MLANRLNGVLAKVISKTQNAFAEGKQILDAMLIANEVINSILKSNGGAILCKLDIKKAYDHVEWSFLLTIMEKMGFGEKWLRWIKWCLSIAKFSVVVNGTPSGFFQSFKGLRRGDPLSPYLFVIVMEALNCLLKRAVYGGFLSACQVWGRGCEVVQVSHLLFADDTLIFCEVQEEQMTFLCWLLMWFEAISGLKVNLNKSELISVGRVSECG